MSYPSSPDSLVRDQRLDEPLVPDAAEQRYQEHRETLREIVRELGIPATLELLSTVAIADFDERVTRIRQGGKEVDPEQQRLATLLICT